MGNGLPVETQRTERVGSWHGSGESKGPGTWETVKDDFSILILSNQKNNLPINWKSKFRRRYLNWEERENSSLKPCWNQGHFESTG